MSVTAEANAFVPERRAPAAPQRVPANLACREYELRMQSTLLRTIGVVLRVGAERPSATLDAVRAELVHVERELANLPSEARPMQVIADRLGWSELEVDFVWASVALAADPRLLVHARALDPAAVQGMSIALYSRIAQLDAESAYEIGRSLQPDRVLARSGMLLTASGAWIPTSAPWHPTPELLDYLLDERDARLPAGVAVVEPPAAVILDAEQRAAVERIRAALGSPGILLVVQGIEGAGRRSAIALASDRPVLALELAHVERSSAALNHALVALLREASLRDAVAAVVGLEELAGEGVEGLLRVLGHRIDQASVPVAIVTAREGFEPRSALPVVRVAWPLPDVSARVALWREWAGGTDDEIAMLAQRFRTGAGAIARAAKSARAIAKKASGDPLRSGELVAGMRHNTAERMAGLAERVIVKQTWEDCVLPEDVATQVLALLGRAEQAHRVFEQWGYRTKVARGTGVAALFSGPPGTGKTMVAGLIANELGLELYQVDLAKIVSKWIGETEKHLGKLFDAAEDGHAVLLFDEADALFGKRSTEVRGATDRYANLEVNYLLQRIESFHGIAILTTNLDASIDAAFKRRLAAHVVFQHPEEHERALLWQRMIGAEGAPLARDIDARALAHQFPKMTGANIRNAALAAAFLAAAQHREQIDHATLVAAARSEYLSMGHILTTGTL